MFRRFGKHSSALLDWLSLVLALGLASYTRWVRLDLVEFKSDEATALNLAIPLLEKGVWPLVGMRSSVGIHNPPLFEYLVAIPLTIARDAALATGFVGLLYVLAVAVCYRFTLDHFGQRAAQIATPLLAVTPLTIVLTRKLQGQATVPLFAVLFLSALFATFMLGKPSRLIMVFLWLAVLLQLHLSAVSFIPLTLLLLILFRRQVRLRYLLAGLGVFTLTFMPYLIWQFTHGFEDFYRLMQISRSLTHTDAEAWQRLWGLLSSVPYHNLLGPAYYKGGTNFLSFGWVSRLEGSLFLASVAYLLLNFRPGGRLQPPKAGTKVLLLLLFIGVPPLFFTRHSVEVYEHYFLIVQPALFIVIGVALADFLQKLGGLAAKVSTGWHPLWQEAQALATVSVMALIAIIVGGQTYQFQTFINIVNWGNLEDGNYGVPLRYQAMLGQSALEAAKGTAVPLYVGLAEERMRGDWPATLQFLTQGKLPIRTFDAECSYGPIRGQEQALVLFTKPDSCAALLFSRHFSAQQVVSIKVGEEGKALNLYHLEGQELAELERLNSPRPLDITFGNGVRLEGYQVDERVSIGDSLCFALHWSVPEGYTGPEPQYTFFNHLLDRSGRPWGQNGGLGDALVREGTRAVSWYQIPVVKDAPLGLYWLLTGMYEPADMQRVPIVGTSPPQTALKLGPIVVAAKTAPVPPDRALRYRWGEEFSFLGFNIDQTELAPEQTLNLSLYWQAIKRPQANYTVFVHLLDNQGRLVAQRDSEPLNGNYPTALWSPKETVVDNYRLVVPTSVAPGTYYLRIGMYLLDTMQRLDIFDVDTKWVGNSLSLAEIKVTSP